MSHYGTIMALDIDQSKERIYRAFDSASELALYCSTVGALIEQVREPCQALCDFYPADVAEECAAVLNDFIDNKLPEEPMVEPWELVVACLYVGFHGNKPKAERIAQTLAFRLTQPPRGYKGWLSP